jgi:hypothetical protein
MEIKFPVRHYTSLHDIFVTLKKHFTTPERKQGFVNTFHAYVNKYVPSDGYVTELSGVCYGQNSLQIAVKLVSQFPVLVYNGLQDLAKTITPPANCRSSRIPESETNNSNFAAPEPIFVYTDIIKSNLVEDSYVKLLTSLYFPSPTGHHSFYSPIYGPVEQSFIESIGIRLVKKYGEDVAFDDSDIPCLVILHFKKTLRIMLLRLSGTMFRYTRYYINQSGGGEIDPVYKASSRVQRGHVIGSFFQRTLPFC